ncbi:POTE ankyrin domain family member A [Alexandromys fortis]|uniref:POTE ankyrin domain family member A n=1 Tax=Alexandromys fortis TaxID=100897 RepID=UPI0021521A24|nr:POTE ankyrin domain family member A [Microtus fortis]
MAFAKKFFRVREKTPLGFCDGPQMTVSEFPNYPKYHATYRPVGQIHRVAAEGDAGRMEILIMLGQCSVFDRDHKNRTALHFACVYGRLPVVNILLKNNCEIDAFDKRQITPLMKSVQCWKQKCAAVLLEHGADPNIRDSSGNCALHYAVYNGHKDMAALLLEYHANIEQKTKDGFTPLLLALREKRVEVAEFLVKKGADIHVVDDMQRNTLMYAIRCGSKDIAMLLLQKGIDFFYKDVFGWTALRYAVEGHCTFRQMLLDFEENIHNNKKDNEPEQMDSGNDSLARISGCCSPGLPLPVVKEEECSCDAKVKGPSAECASLCQSAAEVRESVATEVRESVATEARESVTNETIEKTELLPFLPELELISVEEDIPDESENNQLLSTLEHLPQKNVGHLSGTGYQMGNINISGQMKEFDEEHSQLTTPIEIKDDDFKEASTTKNTPAFKSEKKSSPTTAITCLVLKPVQMKTPLPCKAPARKEVKAFGPGTVRRLSGIVSGLNLRRSYLCCANLRERICVSVPLHLKDAFSSESPVCSGLTPSLHLLQPQPMGTAHSSMAEDERGVNAVSDQEKGLHSEYSELKVKMFLFCILNVLLYDVQAYHQTSCFKLMQDAIENQDLVLMEDSTVKQEESLTAGVKTAQLRSEEEQTGRCGSGKKQRKPFFEQLQLKWNVRVCVNPEVRVKHAAEERGVTTAQLRPKKEQTGRFGSDKKQRKEVSTYLGKALGNLHAVPYRCSFYQPIFERLQSKWCAQISTDPEESRENTGAAEEKGATTVQLRPEEEQTKRNGCDKKQRKPIFERFQPKWSARVSVGPEESRGNTGATGEKESPKLVASEEQTGCHDSEKKPQLHILEQFQPKRSVRVCVETKEGENTEATETTCSSDEYTELKSVQATTEKQGSVPTEDPTMAQEISSMAETDSTVKSKEMQRSPGYDNSQSTDIDHISMTVGQRSKDLVSEEEEEPGLEAASGDEQNKCYSSESNQSLGAGAAAGAAAAADGGIADSTMESGEINDQRFLIKENAKHDGPRNKTSKGKHKVTKEVRAMVDVTQASETVLEDDSGGSLKIQDLPNSYNALLDLKKIHELLRKKNQKIENKIIALRKELKKRREEKSKLEDEIVEQDEELCKLRYTLCKEFKETRIIHKNIKKHLHEKQKQFNERVTMAELERHLRSARAILKELQESQRQHIETLKITQKMKDHLQRIEQELSELKVEVKEQAKKMEELRGCLQNSPLKLEQNEKLTQAGTQETLEELCENIFPTDQTGIRIQSLRSESSKMKTGKDSSTSAQKSYEQQCIEELRISNSLLFNLYRNRRLDKSCTQVHTTVEQDTSPLPTPETRFSLENPCVASSCPHRHFFPCGHMVLPGNPRSSDDCMRSYPVTMEDEENSIKVLTKLKQSLEYNLYQQQKKNDELQKEITRNKKLLKMAKIGQDIGECSSDGNSKTGHF